MGAAKKAVKKLSPLSHLLILFQEDTCVLSSETEGVAHGHVYGCLSGFVGYEVQVAFRIRCGLVDGGRKDVLLQCLDTGNGLNRSAGAHQMSCGGLGGGYGQLVCVITEQ